MIKRDKQLSVYIPKRLSEENLIGRLNKIAEERDRSVNYLVVQAITEYLQNEEKDAE